jgi:hypothetical protein
MSTFGWGDAISLGGTLLGYKAAQDAAKQQASTLTNLGTTAAQAAQFKPYSVTTGYGSSFFDRDKQTAGYALNPVLEAFRNKMYGGSADVMDQLNLDPEKAAEAYMAQQQGLLAPTRQAEDISLRNQQLGRGRIGLGVSGSAMGAGGTGMINPEQYQRDLARARIDAQMAAGSREQAQADIDRLISRGTGMFQTGAGIEALGMKPLEAGGQLGGYGVQAGGNMAQSLLSSGTAAAQANMAAGLGSAGLYNTLGTTLGGMFSSPSTAQRYGTNTGSQQTSMLAAQEYGMR